jgi:TolA-binding protein
VKSEPELLAAEADPHVMGLSRLARQHLQGEAARRDAASFARVGEKVEAKKRSGRRLARVGAAAATLSIAAACALFVTRHRALTYSVVNGAVVDGPRIIGGAGTEVRFSDGSELALEPGSETRIAALDAHGGRVSLDEGTAKVSIAKLPGAAWTLGAGPYSVRVTGTKFSLHWSNKEQAFEIAMRSGSVVVTGPLISSGIALHAGQRLHSVVSGGRLVVEDDAVATTKESPAPGEAARAPESALTPPAPALVANEPATPPSAAPSSASAPSAEHIELDWRKKAAQGAFGDVIDAAEKRGLEGTLASVPLEDLAALADSARYARRSGVAKRALLAERARFPKSGAARDAAFFLGRMAEDEGSGATEWYDRYLAESPQGAYASQALGRKMMLVYQQHGAAAARAVAAEYLARYPDGSYAATASKISAEPAENPK